MTLNITVNIIAQILGFGGVYMLFTLYQQKERKKLLYRKLCADVLWGVHYLLVPGDCVMAVGDKSFADVCVNACDDFALGKKPEIHASFVRSCLCFVYYI